MRAVFELEPTPDGAHLVNAPVLLAEMRIERYHIAGIGEYCWPVVRCEHSPSGWARIKPPRKPYGFGPPHGFADCGTWMLSVFGGPVTCGHHGIGTCPLCGEEVTDAPWADPVWTCPRDLDPNDPIQRRYWQSSTITEADMEHDQVWSHCYEDHGGYCDDHMPMHGRCYDKLFTVVSPAS